MRVGHVIFCCLFIFYPVIGQNNFKIEDERDHFKLSYNLVNDLVIIPVTLNGVELSFLLDTGVDNTILFSLNEQDSMEIKNTQSIYLKGMGKDAPIKALKSDGNSMKIGEAYTNNLPLYIIYEHEMSLSNRMGVPIHGIIGYDFFKDFIVQFNFQKKKLKVYDAEKFKYKDCRKCEKLNIKLHKNKPHVQLEAQITTSKVIPLNLLIDSGSGDAIWLFQTEKNNISTPIEYFDDFLGYSLSGSVYGKRSRIKNLKLGRYNLQNITASFPGTLYTAGINKLGDRDGSIGSKILKRFNFTIDYKNNLLVLKPNLYYEEPFEYDMSGIVLAHAGFTLIKDVFDLPYQVIKEEQTDYVRGPKLKFTLEPQYIVVEVREDSPAQQAGLQQGDNLISVNGRPAYRFSISQLIKFFSSKEGKKVKLKIDRQGTEQIISFRLKRIL